MPKIPLLLNGTEVPLELGTEGLKAIEMLQLPVTLHRDPSTRIESSDCPIH